jgi:hypothetical protein
LGLADRSCSPFPPLIPQFQNMWLACRKLAVCLFIIFEIQGTLFLQFMTYKQCKPGFIITPAAPVVFIIIHIHRVINFVVAITAYFIVQ